MQIIKSICSAAALLILSMVASYSAMQICRFKERLTNPLKRWKLSYDDFRNRSHWSDYEVAIEDMLERTSPKRVP